MKQQAQIQYIALRNRTPGLQKVVSQQQASLRLGHRHRRRSYQQARKPNFPLGVYQDVVGLDVTMGEASIVRISQRLKEIPQPLHRKRKWGARMSHQPLPQGDPLGPRDGHEGPPILEPDFICPNQAWVYQPGGR
jgi:hypothetical protein